MALQRSSTLAVAVIVAVVATLLTADLATATSRSVNISSVWFLPQEGFPVFYRYFKDRITWFEADAVCQFHHANLVTVDTSEQYDATRAYLKELDIATNVWIGLKRPSATEDFAWTDYKKMDPTGGYWQEQIPTTTTPLCAATDPAADFRWHNFNCGGPEVASFICELPVPAWARKEDGCMLTSLPSLTVVFLPEQAAVELASDCGLDGTRRIACKGQANREEMMKQLSCDRGATSPDDDTASMSNEVTSSSVGTTGVRTWTGHSHEPPTRHRRDTDILTTSVTTAVSEEARPNTTNDVNQLPSTGTIASTEVTVDSSTVTTVKEELEEPSSILPEVFVEELTTGKKTTNQEPQLSTTVSESSTQTMTEELNYSSSSPESSTVTPVIEEGFIEVRELEIVAENITVKNIFEVVSTSQPQTTVRSESPVEPTKMANSSETESVVTALLTSEILENEGSPPIDVKEVRNEKNVSTESHDDETTTTDQSTSVSTAITNTTNTNTADIMNAVREEAASNYTIIVESRKSDEIKSREEVEEELLKEAERKEEERKFKEEEETRRRQFLPSPLRSLPDMKTTSPPPAPPLVEEYEEPEEVMEPEPEVPARPNRGRRLTRPQPHSFYPYFLNRVLG